MAIFFPIGPYAKKYGHVGYPHIWAYAKKGGQAGWDKIPSLAGKNSEGSPYFAIKIYEKVIP